MQRLIVTLTALTLAIVQMHAGSLDWVLDIANTDNIARTEAQSLVWDGIPHAVSARFEKTDIIGKDWPFYLFHVVVTDPSGGLDRNRSSYLVCFRLTERATEFNIVTVIQYASNPPTEQEITLDKLLNRWPMSPPWRAEIDLPHKIKPPGLNVVLDMCRAESNQVAR